MSIINDALKKTQLNLKKPKRAAKKKPNEQPQYSGEDITNVYEKMYKAREEEKDASVANQGSAVSAQGTLSIISGWMKPVFALGAIALILGSAYYIATQFTSFEGLSQFTNKKNSSQIRISRKPAKKRVYKPGELVLNGTSMVDGNRIALINDNIYELGDMIDGKKITSINSNAVELRDNEKIFTLKVR